MSRFAVSSRQWTRSAVASLAAVGVITAVAAPAHATADPATAALADSADVAAEPYPGLAHDAVQAALQRDLGLSADQVDAVTAALDQVSYLADQAREQFGATYAGSWFDSETATLTVATTDQARADLARHPAMDVVVVERSAALLHSIQDDFDQLVRTEPETMADAYGWGVDLPGNRVVLTVDPSQLATYERLTAEYGDAVRVEPGIARPEPANHSGSWLDGGVAYNVVGGYGCSVGFNAHDPVTGDRYFLTAGHCADVNDDTTHGGTALGTFVESTFPTYDEALVEITNSSFLTGPYVWTYPNRVVIEDAADSPIGTPVCAIGRTTEVTCGEITQKGATANYAIGPVFDMGIHDACTRSGDSGGATISPGYHAEGIHSGSVSIDGQCPEESGQQNQAYYQEVTHTLDRYETQFGVELTVGP